VQRIAKERGKWPHELEDLDVDEYQRLMAFEMVAHFEATGEKLWERGGRR
jgi:hypothetical protein